MAAVKWTGKEFRVIGQLLTPRIFKEWIVQDGRIVLERALKNTRMRWFFGRTRVKRLLFLEAKWAARPEGAFSLALSKELDQMPNIIRKLGILIRRREQKDLYSVDSTKALVVIPRGAARSEFILHLIEKLSDCSEMAAFFGLAGLLLRAAGREAEELFFADISKGAQYLFSNSRTMILRVDPEYRWQLKGVNGHYYCGYASKSTTNLDKRSDLRKFRSEMEEVLYGQQVHLKRLRPGQVAAIAGRFRSD
jgi:hypothetical protein